jgi:hypothetical protein
MLEQEAAASYQQYTQQAYWFYQQLLAPVLKAQPSLNRLVFVTDGELGHLPFEAFLTAPAPAVPTPYDQLHYLLNDYNISYNYSAALWKENLEAPEPQNNGQIFAVAANYAWQLDSAQRPPRLLTDERTRATLQPLPGAQKEIAILYASGRGLARRRSIAPSQTRLFASHQRCAGASRFLVPVCSHWTNPGGSAKNAPQGAALGKYRRCFAAARNRLVLAQAKNCERCPLIYQMLR